MGALKRCCHFLFGNGLPTSLIALVIFSGAHRLPAQDRPSPARPVIIVGGDSNFPPFEFINENGEASGYNVDLVRALGDAMGFEPEFRLGPWDSRVAALQDGTIDVLPMFYSEARARYADFTTRHTALYNKLFIRKGGPRFDDIEDISGHEVIVERDAYPHEYIRTHVSGVTIIPADSEPDALRLLAAGTGDCALVAELTGYYTIEHSNLENLVSGSHTIIPIDYCFAVAQGHPEIVRQLNDGLRIITASGQKNEIYDFWFAGITPDEHSFWEIVALSVWILLPLAAVALIALLWSWSLRRRVVASTRELVRVNRALKTMSECNQAILKAGSESELLEILCRIITGVGNYRMAWVGIMDNGGYENIRLEAISGVEQDFFKRMREIDKHAPLELKPYVRAIKSGGPVITRDIKSDPAFAPWRELAVEGQIVSAVSLPLKSGDSIYGCCSIYSSECDSFNDDEIALLDELAADIGYGIASLRTRRERDHAVQAMLESQKRMSTVFHKSPFGHILCKYADSTIIEVNKAFLNMTGFSENEVIGRTFHDFIAQDDSEIWQRFFSNSGQITNVEIRFSRKNGQAGNGLLSLDVFNVNEEKYIVGFLNDITPRKQAEDKVVHLNAVLRGIRNVNQLITREHDHDTILQKACDLLVEARGFKSVCIGLLDRKTGAFESIYGAGRKLPVMKELLSRRELPDCAKRVLNSVETVVRHPGDRGCELCLDPDNTGWRDAVVVRLEYEGTIYGFMIAALPVGSGDDPEEQDLLHEVAGDIAFALSSIDTAAERDRAMKEIENIAKFPSENPNPVMRLSFDGMVLYANDAANALLKEDGSGPGMKAPSKLLDSIVPIIESGAPDSSDTEWHDKTYAFGVAPIPASGYVNLYGRDITQRKRLEEQLRQSQKMEAIGRLAGGVAHDFNNMLSVIMGYAELALELTDADEQISPLIREIHNAGVKAAALTGQLLAFSRKQVMKPEVFDPNSIIAEIRTMLERLLGEDIDLVTVLADNLGNVKADPGQIEQVIMNLAINARDAMPTGGKLTIETANVDLDEDYTRRHPSMKPGPHVMLAVSDTGVGMDEEVLSQIFEPFYTTKHETRGTGLGLATTYGIVKQSGGNIWVYSEVGGGTTFKVYFPEVEESLQAHRPVREFESLHGTETILVVEDDDSVRKLAQHILSDAGFTVIAAMNADEAEAVCSQREDPVNLVLTDVVMPGASGREMADHLQQLYPEIEVLYMSGYTDNSIVHHGILDEGTNFIGKPFSAIELVRKVREILDEHYRSQ